MLSLRRIVLFLSPTGGRENQGSEEGNGFQPLRQPWRKTNAFPPGLPWAKLACKVDFVLELVEWTFISTLVKEKSASLFRGIPC